MKKIKLTQGKFALVDDNDFEYLNQFKWCYQKKRRVFGEHGYAVRNFNHKVICMHNVILKRTPDNKSEPDHKDGDGINNQKKNLRLCSRSQNSGNMKSRPHSSKYKGVSFFKRDKFWTAQIHLHYKKFHLGLFKSEKAAARAYDKAATKLFGEFARLNFT